MKNVLQALLAILLWAPHLAQARCGQEDFTLHVSADQQCLVMRRWGDESPEVLLVWLHGDVSDGGPANYHFQHAERGAALAPNRKVLSVALLRPGYPDGQGNASTAAFMHGGRQDHHTRENFSEVAAAIARLRERFKPRQVIAIGHSGGAATAGVILGMRPGVIDAAVLVACPCAKNWRDGRRPWPRSDNAANWIEQVPLATGIVALTGEQDDNTTPAQAQGYVQQLVQRGVTARFISLPREGHNSAFRSPQVMEAVWSVMMGAPTAPGNPAPAR